MAKGNNTADNMNRGKLTVKCPAEGCGKDMELVKAKGIGDSGMFLICPASEDFKAEVKKYNLRYKCVDCAHFHEPNNRCSFDYPIDQTSYFYIMNYGEGHIPRFSFCKHFELN
ncbi:MAG: hypothetical protein NTY22_06120 [Proteobacteria bacterium]|nr:hypothetical protein [Pseudomonadota bacterium]